MSSLRSGDPVHFDDAELSQASEDFAIAGALDAPASHRELWEGLVSGRWQLVDSSDREGYRWLLLRRADDPRPLTAREQEVVRRVATGESNKAIAIDLEVSPSAVARTLTRALKKLRLASRADLARLVPGSAAVPK